MLQVIKRNCEQVNFDKSKISDAILKAMKNGSGIVKPKIAESIASEIEDECRDKQEVSISDIESMVYDKLITKKQRLTAKAYEGYRSIREFQRENENTTDEEIAELLNGESEYWNTENSNKNAKVLNTQRDYMAGIVSKDISRRFLLPPEIVQAHDEGIIHFHDIDYFGMNAMTNCSLINLEDMLQNGTCINKVMIEKPHRFITACTIATQIILGVTSMQYGGATITLTHLAPFVRDSYEKYYNKYKSWGFKEEDCKMFAERDTKKEVSDGVQTFNYQCNSMSNSNGQSPFLSVFMYLGETTEYKKELAMIIEEFLKQRLIGLKNEVGVYVTQAFPKLLYVLEEDNIRPDSPYYYLTKLAARCSAKRMVPDYISEKKMKELKEGNCFPNMGCVDGKELITYKIKDNLYVESFERMWRRLSDSFHIEHQFSNDNPNLYMDLNDVKIYDTEKGFVTAQRIIRNISNDWLDINFSNGRRLLCTTDHVLTLRSGNNVQASNLKIGDKLLINSNQYTEETILFNTDKAWLLGFMLCDGCYQNNHVFASIAASNEDEIEEKFNTVFTKYFGLSTKTILQQRGIKGTYKDLCAVADENNGLQYAINYFTSKFEGINKANRRIPNEVFAWNYTAKLAFLAGMIDADGYINSFRKEKGYSVVQIGSTNKELALGQMALVQALGMPAKIYHNHYTKKNPDAIRYRVEFYPCDELINYIVCKKKYDNYIESEVSGYNFESEVTQINPIHKTMYSYDVTTSSEHFEVSGIYSHNCRSFLSPYKNENNQYKFYGRFNQGVVTLNLVDVALSSEGDYDKFWELMEQRTELCHKALLCRHKRLEGTLSDVAPILWQYGAFARLKKGETIDKLLHNGYSSISLGYAGLYESVKYMTGKSHIDSKEGRDLGIQIMRFMNDKCTQWNKEHNIGFSIYGSPIENTTYKFAKCLEKRFGVIDGITNKNYITNSYHTFVREPINAFDKLTKESEFQSLSLGGAISYIETSGLTNNIDAVLEVMNFIYDHIMYAELNTKSDYCQVCGYDGEIQIIDEDGELIWECPNCHNRNKDKMNVARRTCGYIGTNFWGRGRTQEIKERYVHLDDIEEEGK